MSVQVDYFSTSKFIVKPEKVDRLKELVELLKDEANTNSGYYSSEHYANLYDYGNNCFSLHTGGYCDGGPDLKDTVVNGFDDGEYESEEQQDEYNGSHSIFNLIEKLLETDAWFFVDSTGFEKGRIYNSLSFHHENGKSEGVSSWELKRDILKKYDIKEKV